MAPLVYVVWESIDGKQGASRSYTGGERLEEAEGVGGRGREGEGRGGFMRGKIGLKKNTRGKISGGIFPVNRLHWHLPFLYSKNEFLFGWFQQMKGIEK